MLRRVQGKLPPTIVPETSVSGCVMIRFCSLSITQTSMLALEPAVGEDDEAEGDHEMMD